MKSPGSRAAALPPPGHARPSSLHRQRGHNRILWGAGAVFAAVALVAIVLPSGRGSGAPARAAPPEQPDPNVAVVPAVDSAGFFVALYEGLFTRHGLHVHFIPAVSSETVLGAQEAGRIGISCGNYVSYVQAQEQHQADLYLFAEGSVMQAGTQGLYVMPGSKIRDLADLKGRTIAVNAPRNILYLLAASALASNGIPPSQARFVIPPGGFPAMLAWLKAGRADAAVLPEPFASIAELSMGVVPLVDLNQGATLSFPVQGCAVTRAWARTHPRTLAAFRAAFEQGQQIADTSRPAVEHAMESLPAPFGLTPVQAAVLALDSYPVGPVDTVRLQRVADVMHQFLGAPVFSMRSMVTGHG
jgi:ABC-type nitrate/sulfonate/bicarbonate transport system substrate-binding protein